MQLVNRGGSTGAAIAVAADRPGLCVGIEIFFRLIDNRLFFFQIIRLLRHDNFVFLFFCQIILLSIFDNFMLFFVK